MDFIKKNYEKVLLGLVLLGLVVAAAFLQFMISAERASLDEQRISITKRPVKQLKELDLSRAEGLLARLQAPFSLDLSSTNKLFNPVRWATYADGQLHKMPVGSESASLEVTRITKLYLRVTLDDVRTSDSSGTRYGIGIQREAAPNPLQRGKRPSIYASLPGDAIKKDAFTLLEASGPPDNPQLKLKLSDSDDPVSIATNKPYTRVDGYAADLYFPSEKKSFPNKRSVGIGTAAETTVFFGGESYKIVAINANEVVLLSARTEKKTTIKYNAVPEPR